MLDLRNILHVISLFQELTVIKNRRTFLKQLRQTLIHVFSDLIILFLAPLIWDPLIIMFCLLLNNDELENNRDYINSIGGGKNFRVLFKY